MSEPRKLKTEVLSEFARVCAVHFPQESRWSNKKPAKAIYGREWVMQSLYQLHFKDEFDYVLAAIKPHMGEATLKEFEKASEKAFSPRSDAVLAEELEKRLAITPEGEHVPGKIGNVVVGSRQVATRVKTFEKRMSMRKRLVAYEAGEKPLAPDVISMTKRADWPIYAGEEEERAMSDGGVADSLPDPKKVFVGDEHLKPVKGVRNGS